MHERVQLEFTEIGIVYVHITIHFPQIHTEAVGIVINQVHRKRGLVVPDGLDLEIFQVAVIKCLGFAAGGKQEHRQDKKQ